MIEKPLPQNRRLAPKAAPPSEKPKSDKPSLASRLFGDGFFARKKPASADKASPSDAPAEAQTPAEKPQKPAKAVSTPPRPPFRVRYARPLQKLALAGRLLLGTLLFFGLMGGSSYGLYRYVSSTPRFAIKEVVVEGLSRRSVDDVSRAGHVEKGKNIFGVDLELSRRLILQDPWIEQASVDRKLPSTIKITVTEREATSLVSLGGSLYLAGRGGKIFKRYEQGDPADLVVITGAGGEGELVRDRDGLTSLVRHAQDLIADYERLGPNRIYPLQEVNVDAEGRMRMLVGRDGVSLMLGKPPFRAKIERAARVLSEIDRRKGQPQIVFLDNEAHPERVVARMR